MSNMVRIQGKRKAQDDKDTRFKVRGRLVAQDNIDRWQKRQKTAPPENDVPAPVQDRKLCSDPLAGDRY
jgi:hypothetical protein